MNTVFHTGNTSGATQASVPTMLCSPRRPWVRQPRALGPCSGRERAAGKAQPGRHGREGTDRRGSRGWISEPIPSPRTGSAVPQPPPAPRQPLHPRGAGHRGGGTGLSPLALPGHGEPGSHRPCPRAPGLPPAPAAHSPPRSTNRSVCLSELKSPKAARVPRASGPKS